MGIVKVLLFAAAVSLDGLAAGVVCGLQRIRVPLLSQVVIIAASGMSVLAAMLAGTGVSCLLGEKAAQAFGAGLLLLIAGFFLLQSGRDYLRTKPRDVSQPLLSFRIRPLGVMVHILEEPESADRDASGEISWKEAGLLGLALALDSFGAGMGMALLGGSISKTVLSVMAINWMTVRMGLYIGERMGKTMDSFWTSLVAGMIFLLLAVAQII